MSEKMVANERFSFYDPSHAFNCREEEKEKEEFVRFLSFDGYYS
jgi:hypothetical protein